MLIPRARGPLSRSVFEAMRTGADGLADLGDVPGPGCEDDAAITLWTLYELHYRGFEDAEGDLEWHPGLLGVRRGLELDLERRLRSRYETHRPEGDFAEDFFTYVADHDGPSLAGFVQSEADAGQVLELLQVRSVYHLKEADPTVWVVPRLETAPKAALMELQYDEYGVGDPNRLHAHLFARGMRVAGLRPEYGAYIDEVPLEVLEQNNAMSLFGLHRSLRGAALGHLAAFEASSSAPSLRMVQGLERLDFPAETIHYYAEHIEADAVHEQLAVRTICGALVESEPELLDDIYLGAFTCLDLEDRVAHRLLERWAA